MVQHVLFPSLKNKAVSVHLPMTGIFRHDLLSSPMAGSEEDLKHIGDATRGKQGTCTQMAKDAEAP